MTEVEIIRVDEFMSMIILKFYFIEVQVYTIESNLLFEDKKSALILEVDWGTFFVKEVGQ